jgi:hypothetical protein
MTLARIPYFAPSLAAVLHKPMRPCLAVTASRLARPEGFPATIAELIAPMEFRRPIGMQVGFTTRLIDARLIGAERTAALESDAFEWWTLRCDLA